MNYIKNFINQIKDGIYNPSFYSGLMVDGKVRHGFFHLFKMYIIVSFLWGIVLVAVFLPLFVSVVTPEAVKSAYPQELVVTVENGELSINQEEPYIILDKNKEGVVSNLFVIDTNEEVTLEAIDSYDAFAFFTKTNVIVKEENDRKIYSLDALPDVVFDEDKAVDWVGKIRSYTYILFVPLAALLIVIGSFAAALYYSFLAIFAAFFVMFVAKIRKVSVAYRKAYVVALYAFTPVIVIDLLTDVVGVNADPFWFSTIIFVVAIVVNIKGSGEVEQPPI